MPNTLNADGLTTKTRAELLSELTSDFETIYGSDINLDSDTPDGQILGIFIQSYLDLLDLLSQVYNSFDPDNAIGVVLDQRVAINGIQRQSGTFTVTNITVVTDQALNLYGLDQSVEEVFTVQDDAGNQFQLIDTYSAPGSGSHVLAFQAAEPGEVLTIPNTITTPVTIVLGVTSVNNPTSFTTLGINEETDNELKLRRRRSVSLASQGYLAGLLAALENLTGMNSAFVYENNTAATDADGVPSHSIWVIVSGTASDEDIANAIYQKRNAGCGMFGSESYTITQIDGSPFIINWDEVIQENLFIKFKATSINEVDPPDIANIRPGLVTSFVPGVFEEVNINSLATDVQEIDSNTLVTLAGFSTAKEQSLIFSAIPDTGSFKVNYNGNASADINYNDDIATVRSKIQAISGLSGVNVTGDIATGQVDVDLTSISSIETLLTITDNTLESSYVDVDIETDIGEVSTIEPTTKQYQFVILEENIIIDDLQLLPSSANVLVTEELQLNTYGGYGEYTYEISVDNSGGSIDANGLFTAGASPGTDTITVTDELGNTDTATIEVI
jgi:hypothetical protein